jgi:predicted extracellular nuclease
MNMLTTAAALLPVLVLTVGPATAQVRLNELYSRGITSAPDWIEVYNGGASEIDISGYKIYDNGGQAGTKPKKLFPAGSLIPAQGVIYIVSDTTDPSGFGLSSGGEKVWLEDSAGTLIDSVEIPALGVDTSYARVPDGSANWTKFSPTTRGALNVAPPTVFLNELYSRGITSAPDWIEVYNGGASQIDISGYRIYDNGGQAGTKPKKLFPAGAVIPAKGVVYIVCDTSDASGFGLSNGGEKVWLEDAAGTLIDSIEIPALGVDTSYARVPDGSANWAKLSPTTKGALNVAPPTVFLNELYSRGITSAPDWIEVYNGGTSQIDISGYKVYDNGGQAGTKPKKLFPAGAVIPAKGVVYIVCDTSDASGFGLSSGGEKVWLEDSAGTLIDSVEIPALGVDTSYARVPDGSATWTKLSPTTKGALNAGTVDVRPPDGLAEGFALLPNYPNPFNPSTTITFDVAKTGMVQLRVFDVLGREVTTLVDGVRSAGRHSVRFHAAHLSSGMYVCRLTAGGMMKEMKLSLVK